MLDRRAAVVAGVVTLAVVAAAATPQLLGAKVADALDRMGHVNPAWIWLAALGFVCAIVGSAAAWRAALELCGARISLGDSCARFAVGSLVNSFTPARLGDAARIALYSRKVDHRDRLWSTGGAFAALGAARSLVLVAVAIVGTAMGAVPKWWLLVLLGLVTVAATVAFLSRRVRTHGRAAHALDAFRTLGREPWRALRIAAWIAFASCGRIGAAAAIASSFGIHRPLTAALIIIAAHDVAGLLPLTPGNVGLTSGAIAVALRAHNVPLTLAISTGIAFHAVETLVGILFGTGAALSLARPSRPWLVAATAAAGCLALVGIGATLFLDFA